jgi:hypothetical protein
MDTTHHVDEALDDALHRARPQVSAEALESAAALPGRLRRSSARRARWGLGAALAGAITLSGTAAVAVPLLLQPLPGYEKVVAFSYGVRPGAPGIRCQTIIAVKRLTNDGRYDSDIVIRFEEYLRSQHISVPIPESARQPYTGSTSTRLYDSPAVAALNHAYSDTMREVYDRFESTDAAATAQTPAQIDVALAHSATLQDTVSCVGAP